MVERPYSYGEKTSDVSIAVASKVHAHYFTTGRVHFSICSLHGRIREWRLITYRFRVSTLDYSDHDGWVVTSSCSFLLSLCSQPLAILCSGTAFESLLSSPLFIPFVASIPPHSTTQILPPYNVSILTVFLINQPFWIITMDINQSIFSTDGEVSHECRAPLAEMPYSANIPTKQIRRKSSFAVRVDSSEDPPSLHDSIFEAVYISPNNSDEVETSIELVKLHNHSPGTQGTTINDENSRQGENVDDSAIDDADFLYGRGTVLDTITEQKSFGTLQTLPKENSIDNLPNFPFVRHRDSFALSQHPRRKQAFSLDDIDLMQSSYHEACAMIERETNKQLPVHEIYAGPRTPTHAPLERPQTPEGMPSWTASQALPRATQPVSQMTTHAGGRFRRLFKFYTRKPAPSTIVNTRSVSDPVRGRQAPRFRPPRSVYGLIEQHPFNNAPVAPIDQPPVDSTRISTLKGKNKANRRTSQQVRFTPSATARDSEATALRVAIESTSALAPHPIMPLDGPLPSVVNIKCTHRKGRAALAKATHNLNHRATNPPSNEYVITPPSPNPDNAMSTPWPSRTTSPSRPISAMSSVRSEDLAFMGSSVVPPMAISSTAHLMSGAILSSPSSPANRLPQPGVTTLPVKPCPKPKELWCWKCKFQTAAEKLDHWAMQSVGCFAFVCCGYDFHDDGSYVTYSAANGSRIDNFGGGGANLRGGGSGNRKILGPRRVSVPEGGSQRVGSRRG